MTITKHVFKPEFLVAYDDETDTFSYEFCWFSSHEASYDEQFINELLYGDNDELIDAMTMHVDALLAAGHLPDKEWQPKPPDPEVINAALHFLTTLTNTADNANP